MKSIYNLKVRRNPLRNSYDTSRVNYGVQYLRDHVLKGLHDLGALGFLEVGEAAGDDDDC